MTTPETAAYLERIGYRGSVNPDAETLRQLHKAHLRSVPFENMDIHLGRPIILDEAALYTKVVRNRRGGFCYELNGLFCGLLRALGFSVSMLSAGVARKEGGFGPDFDHMALLVSLERPWLADVGFGDGFEEPLVLDSSADQEQDCGVFRIEFEEAERMLTRCMGAGQWEPQYRFTLQPRHFVEYTDRCLYHQSSPLSSFTRGRIVTLATPEGRVTLSEMRLIVTSRNGQRDERSLSDAAEYRAVLQQYFGIQFD